MQRFWQHPRVIAAAQYAGYTLFFVLAVLLAFPWTFPSRQVRSYIAKQARAQGYPLQMDDVRLRGLGGVEIAGLRLTLPGKPGEPQTGGGTSPALPSVEFKIDLISAKVAIFPLLFGKTIDVRFDIDAGGGSITDGHIVQKGEVFDIDIGKIEGLDLGDSGLGGRALGTQTKLLGEIDGALGGKMAIHYGGTTDDLKGSVDLELADAILRQPELSIQGGLKFTDLAMGTLTLKVKMGLKQNLAALAAERGAEKATVIHIEQLQAEGEQLELITAENSHILIPPGKSGWKAATMQLHFAFHVVDKPAKKKGGKEGAKEGDKSGEEGGDDAADKPVADRLKWTSLLSMAGSKLKPFERGGYIGMTCTGPLARPQCNPAIPQVTIGSRGNVKLDGGAAGPLANPAGGAAPSPDPAVAPGSPPPNVEFKPVGRAEPPPAATPPPSEEQPATPPAEPAVPPPTPGAEQRPPETQQGRAPSRDPPPETPEEYQAPPGQAPPRDPAEGGDNPNPGERGARGERGDPPATGGEGETPPPAEQPE